MKLTQVYLPELETFTRLSHAVGDRADYTQGGGGNTSAKLGDDAMAIKASGFRLSDITPSKAYALIDYKQLSAFYHTSDPAGFEDVEKAGSEKARQLTMNVDYLEPLRPSVEAGFHSILDKYVLHTHSVYANLAACSPAHEEILAGAFAGASFTYTSVPYTDPGAMLTFSIRDALNAKEKAEGKRPEVIIMLNHGIIVHHDDPDRALAVHEEANSLLASWFNTSFEQYPQVALKSAADGSFISDTPYLAEKLRSGAYTPEMLLANPLFPDQMVFFNGTLLKSGEDLREGACRIDPATGLVTYTTKESQALALEQALTAVVFIHETLKEKGLPIQYMGEAARSFIDNWESEKYRKALQKKS